MTPRVVGRRRELARLQGGHAERGAGGQSADALQTTKRPSRRSFTARSAEISQCSWARGRSPPCDHPGSFPFVDRCAQSALADTLRSFIMAPRHVRSAAYVCGAGVLLSLWAWAAAPALAQSGACVLSPDRRNPNLRILLRLGADDHPRSWHGLSTGGGG